MLGSAAAAIQASIYGGAVTAGSAFAVAQSAGAAGVATVTLVNGAVVATAGAGAVYAGSG